jgi:hypothetical protein
MRAIWTLVLFVFCLLGWILTALLLFWSFAGRGLADAQIGTVEMLPLATLLLGLLALFTVALVSIWRNAR